MRKLTQAEFRNRVKDRYFVLSEYKGNKKNVVVKCKVCGNEFVIRADHAMDKDRGGCPCQKTKSLGEMKVERWLSENKLNYCCQVKYNDLIGVGGGKLSYDFGIIKNNKIVMLIEYNGEQHYKYIPYFHKSYSDFLVQKENDRIKREYAKNNGVRLVNISYLFYKWENISYLLKKVVNNDDNGI